MWKNFVRTGGTEWLDGWTLGDDIRVKRPERKSYIG